MKAQLSRVALAALISLAALPVSTARADTTPTAAQRKAFGEAQALFDGGDFAAALPLFEALAAETSSPNAQLYVARCLRELGRTTEAYDRMLATVRDATAKAQADSKYDATRNAAAGELALLEARVAHVILAIADAPEGVDLRLDGAPVDAARMGSAMTVLPGKHRIELSGPDLEPVLREIELAGGESKTVTLLAKRAAERGPSTPGTPAPAPRSSGGGLRVLGFVAAGLGGASLVGFGVTGAMSNGKFATLEEECGGARCTDPGYADVVDDGKTFETIANVTLVTGIVLVASSIPLIAFGGPDEESTSAFLSPTVGGATFSLQQRF